MGYEVQSLRCQPGQSVQFTFQNQVQSFVVGLGQFYVTYGPTASYYIQTLSISLQPSQPSANVVQVTPAIAMADHSGHSIDAGESFIWVVCVAMTGTYDSYTVLGRAPGAITPGQSQIVTLPGAGGNFSVLEVCLSGLNLSYSTADHMYQGATAIAGISAQGTEGTVTAAADLWDANGNHAVTASIGAGVLASVNKAPGFVAGPVTYQATQGSNALSLKFPFSVVTAVALIQGFTVQYPSGAYYGVQTLNVGAQSCGVVNGVGDTVQISACAFTTDGENFSDASQSYVYLLVVAIPQSAA